MAVITRAEWTKIRDGNGVKQGRAKVSIGKTLDAYHAARKCEDRIAKIKLLLDAWFKYVNELDMTVPGEKKLAREIGETHIKDAKDALDKYEELKKVTKNAEALTIEILMKSKRMMELFTRYTRNEDNDENLEFVRGVDKRMQKQELYEKYVSEEAPRQVNLSEKTRTDLDKLAQVNQFDKMNFADARGEIVKFLNRDIIPRFRKTPEFLDLMKAMSGVDE
jgi:regulator of G protein signaling-like protein